MKALVVTLMLILSFNSITAQKKNIEFSETNDYKLNDVYSVIKSGHEPHDYLVSQSDVLIPMNFETIAIDSAFQNQSLIKPLDTEGISFTPSFKVFTIIDADQFNNLEDMDSPDKNNQEILKALPKNFNPYEGMTLDHINTGTIMNPVTSR